MCKKKTRKFLKDQNKIVKMNCINAYKMLFLMQWIEYKFCKKFSKNLWNARGGTTLGDSSVPFSCITTDLYCLFSFYNFSA